MVKAPPRHTTPVVCLLRLCQPSSFRSCVAPCRVAAVGTWAMSDAEIIVISFVVTLGAILLCFWVMRMAAWSRREAEIVAGLQRREARDGLHSLSGPEQALLRRHAARDRPTVVSNIDHTTGNLFSSVASWGDEDGGYTRLTDRAIERIPPATWDSESVPVAARRSDLGSDAQLRFPSEEGLPSATEHVALAFRASDVGFRLSHPQTATSHTSHGLASELRSADEVRAAGETAAASAPVPVLPGRTFGSEPDGLLRELQEARRLLRIAEDGGLPAEPAPL